MKAKRLYELDGLRGIAALAVVVFHYFYNYDRIYGHSFDSPAWARFGFYGVYLFFIISGFVIFWTISKSEHPLDYLWSRFSRLYPVYWVAVCLTFLVVYYFRLPGKDLPFSHVLVNLTMVHEYLGVAHVDGVYWTLSLELAFYFWMLVLFSLKQIKNIEKWLALWIVLGASVAILELEIDSNLEILFLQGYIELFAAGICFFKIKKADSNHFTYLALILSAISLFFQYTLTTALALCLFYGLFYLAVSGKLKFLAVKPLVFLGTISYPLYLIHQNIGYVVLNSFYNNNVHPVLGIITAFLIAFLIAVLLTFVIERPLLKYLRNYYKQSDDLQRFAKKLVLFGSR